MSKTILIVALILTTGWAKTYSQNVEIDSVLVFNHYQPYNITVPYLIQWDTTTFPTNVVDSIIVDSIILGKIESEFNRMRELKKVSKFSDSNIIILIEVWQNGIRSILAIDVNKRVYYKGVYYKRNRRLFNYFKRM